MSSAPVAHILDFFYDNDYNSALTAEIHGVRFHAIADADALQCRLTGSRSNPAGREYLKLIQNLKQAKEDESDDEPASSDSGVDVGPGDSIPRKGSDIADEAEDALHTWIVKAVEPALRDIGDSQHDQERITLEEWYHRTTYFFELRVTDSELSAVELESDKELENRISALTPEISIPKYIRDLGVPWMNARDLIVLDGSASPWPYHPTRVQHGEDVYFLKLVDSTQPQPTKRELSILRKLEEKGLHSQIRVPKLEGLVTFDTHTKLLGFLQTDIPNPVPLTTKLDDEVPEQLRERWADEAEHIKDVLHENGIVWGDAKADNFMVDEEDRLWIIDFGGSYTEGWVDPEFQETEKGDDMGVEKIVNALHDPVNNTWDPNDHGVDEAGTSTESSDDGSDEEYTESTRIRTRKHGREEDELDDLTSNKRQRNEQRDTWDNPTTYCYCSRPSSGDMVACDNESCERQWFHFECAGISQAPDVDQEWYCENCRNE